MVAPHKTITIALDAMGGDGAPTSVLEGAYNAHKTYPNAEFLLYGNKVELGPIFDSLPGFEKFAKIIHTDEKVLDDDKPSQAIRTRKKSSMSLAIKAVKKEEAHGAVSAGNTGALMAMSKLALRTLEGIDRPAIASVFPTLEGECIILDLGANVECSKDNLFQFALMGDAFARSVLGIKHPRVGLLNIGSEDMKGREEIQEAAKMLRETKLPIKFIGYVEGSGISHGDADVIVADGFTGNIALKTAEGTGKLCKGYLKKAFKSSLRARIGYLLARPALTTFANAIDPRQRNGAMFIGLNGIVVKSHGGMDALGFENAIHVAIELIRHNINEQIRREVSATSGMMEKEAS